MSIRKAFSYVRLFPAAGKPSLSRKFSDKLYKAGYTPKILFSISAITGLFSFNIYQTVALDMTSVICLYLACNRIRHVHHDSIVLKRAMATKHAAMLEDIANAKITASELNETIPAQVPAASPATVPVDLITYDDNVIPLRPPREKHLDTVINNRS